MHYDTLVFDLDGTLSDPLLGTLRCMNFALTSLNLQPRCEAEIRRRIGPPLEETLALFADSEDEQLIRQLVDSYRERYGEFGFAENELYADIPQTLQALQEAGYRMAVCTSKLRANAVKILQRFELDGFFEFVSGPDYGMKKSEQLRQLLASGAIGPQAIMIGDRGVDLSAAHSNQLAAAGVLWGYGDRKELAQEKPAFIFESPQALRDTFLP